MYVYTHSKAVRLAITFQVIFAKLFSLYLRLCIFLQINIDYINQLSFKQWNYWGFNLLQILQSKLTQESNYKHPNTESSILLKALINSSLAALNSDGT